jgi:succinyl-CoA synthetase beta subunit
MTLIEKMLRVAELWAEAQGHSSTSRLSNIVANDGRVLAKLAEGGGATISTIDKFVVYLREPANWPEGMVPFEAAELLAAIGHISTLPQADAA